MLSDLWIRLRALFRRDTVEDELDDELRFHFDHQVENYTRSGLTREEAIRQARLKFGGLDQVKEECRDARGSQFLESFAQDVRYAVRMLLKSPGFTAVALLTLVFGIGANAVMFSITNAVLLRPLPYPDADRLISVTTEDPSRGIKGLNVSFTRLNLIQEQSQVLEGIGAYLASNSSLTTHGNPEQVPSAMATRNFFDILGVKPRFGRGFLREEDQPGGANVAIISDAFWQSHFGGQPDAVGRSIPIDGRSVEIIGVLPAGFRFPFLEPEPQVWFPRVFENSAFPPDRVHSGAAFLTVYARLRPSESIPRAQAELDSLGSIYTKTYPGFVDAQKFTTHAESLKESLVGPLRTSLLVLLTAVGFVLLIGCTNLANLLLARATARGKEMAIRRALGASRGRLVRQLLAESLLLSLVGGGIGLFLAANAPLLLRLLPPASLPRLREVTVDLHVVWFSLALCVLTGLTFGLIPAIQISGDKLHDALKEASRGSTGGTRAGRSRAALVVAQVAVALVLVSSAGLLLKSFGKLMRVSPGFDPHHIMTFSFSLPQGKYPQRSQQAEFYRRLVEAVQELPNVQSAAANTFLPISGNLRFVYICPEGIPCQGSGKDPVAAVRHVTPDYFKVMRIPLLRGRVFDKYDNANSKTVCIINEALANQYFPAQNSVAKHIVQFRGNIQTEVVGVVGNVKYGGLNAPETAELYLPQEQSPIPVASSSLVVRAEGSPQPLVASVRAIVAKLDPDLPTSNILSMDDAISTSVAQPRLTARLTAIFGFLALLLAAIGIYGVMAYLVIQRKHEIAIRVALGASPGNILRLIIRHGLALIVVGVMLGIAGCLALTRLFAAILFQISARDPFTLTCVGGLLITVGLLACYLPSRRAMSVDPITALRDE